MVTVKKSAMKDICGNQYLRDYIERHNYKIDVTHRGNGNRYYVSEYLFNSDYAHLHMFLYKSEFVTEDDIVYTLPKELFEI